MGRYRPHSLPQECHGGAKKDRIKIYYITKGQV